MKRNFSLYSSRSLLIISSGVEKSCLLFALILFSFSTIAQSIERKLIIDHGHYYYTTIDPEFQIATLHTGNITDPPKMAKNLALPAGRNYNAPINPFSWDISKNEMFAVNFLNHPLNDRNEALKKFELSSLKEWNEKITVMDMIAQSTEYNMFTYNTPYMAVISQSKTLDGFYYDAISVNDSSYYMATTNNGNFCLWNYNGKEWKQGKTIEHKTDGYFTLFAVKQELYVCWSNGSINLLTMEHISPTKNSIGNLADGFLVVNKDDNTVKFMKGDQLKPDKPVNEQLSKKAITIF